MIDKSDTLRRWKIDITGSGHAFIRGPGQKPEEGTLPCFSTDTKAQAERLLTRHCLLERDKSGLMRVNDWKRGELSEMYRAADLFRATYAGLLKG